MSRNWSLLIEVISSGAGPSGGSELLLGLAIMSVSEQGKTKSENDSDVEFTSRGHKQIHIYFHV